MNVLKLLFRTFVPDNSNYNEYRQWAASCPLTAFDSQEFINHVLYAGSVMDDDTQSVDTTDDDTQLVDTTAWNSIVASISASAIVATDSGSPTATVPRQRPQAFIVLESGTTGMSNHFPIDHVVPQAGDGVELCVVQSNDQFIAIELKCVPKRKSSALDSISPRVVKNDFV